MNVKQCVFAVAVIFSLSGALTAGAVYVDVPDGGATALLMGLAVSGLALLKKHRT